MKLSQLMRRLSMGARTRRSSSRPSGPGDGARIGAAMALVLAVALAGLILFAGCGYGDEVGDAGPLTTTNGEEEQESEETSGATSTTVADDATPTTSARPSAEDETVTFSIYFSRDEKMAPAHRTVPETEGVGATAMRELLDGPSSAEREAGLFTSIPEGTTFLGLDIDDGLATVDLSKEFASGGGSLSMMTRLAQVIYTLTQFPTVEEVSFQLDGKPVEVFSGEGIILDHPVSRSDYEELVSPAILVESPAVHDEVSSPMRVWGTANTFEAVFHLNIVDWDGRIIAEDVVQATSGSGTRGTFDVTVPFNVDRDQRGALIVFERSAGDDSPTNVVEIPLRLLAD